MINIEDYLPETESTPQLSASSSTTVAAPLNYDEVDWNKVQEQIETTVDRVEMSKVDIAPTRNDYRNLAWALQSAYGRSEEGYHLFYRLSQFWYKRQQTDQEIRERWMEYLNSNKYLGTTNGITVGTFFYLAKNAGVDISISK